MNPPTDNPYCKSGFTLVELLVVMTIIGVLSSSATVAFGEARNKARIASGLAFARQAELVLERKAIERNTEAIYKFSFKESEKIYRSNTSLSDLIDMSAHSDVLSSEDTSFGRRPFKSQPRVLGRRASQPAQQIGDR